MFAACIWVLCATATAFMPMRWQMFVVPVLALAAIGVLIAIGMAHGWVYVALGLIAFASMFRHPLRYGWAKLRGQNPQLPEELRK
ncbi:MAG: DUF2484 family protein [Rhodobacteraceae bacterium]|nr:DUF2484 family protein [Paracoccaceae bacterium]